ncbi:long-chain fatty acid transporter fat1 [Coniosporium tulheliwenetii]|uniref:Long-chain fatty acid transporter fat1 n=1 Tax=Coniosporium tulheliwenetii TaxID=3383036 RepID=A0ACC2Z9V6_9PEZI|nr:long-chain fatty acid transporter fat1 [Cladosporium sp. JES 115]
MSPEKSKSPQKRQNPDLGSAQDEITARTRQEEPEDQPRQKAKIDPGYFALNPWYGQPNAVPVFGLGRPLPRVVRRGMRSPQRRPEDDAEGKRGEQDLETGRTGAAARDDSMQRENSLQEGDGPPLGVLRPFDRDPNQRARLSPRNLAAIPEEVGGGIGTIPSVTGGWVDGAPDRQGMMTTWVPLPVVGGWSTQLQERGSDNERRSSGERRLNDEDVPKKSPDTSAQDWISKAQDLETISTSDSTKKENDYDELDRVSSSEVEDDIPDQTEYDILRNRWSRMRARYPQPLAEFLATAVSTYIGLAGSLTQMISSNTAGTFFTRCLSWGLGAMIGIYIAGGVSGAHLNPAISITFTLYRGFPWRHCVIYVIFQLLGNLCASAAAFAVFNDAIRRFDPGLTPTGTGGAFFTIPQPWVRPGTAFFGEFVASAILMIAILALGDDMNTPPGEGMNPFIIGLVITVLEITMGYNTGPCLNPARDLGGRLVALGFGYQDTFRGGWWIWGAWGAVIAGTATGAATYDVLVFVGGESPVNYRWPGRRELRGRWRKVREEGVGRRVRERLRSWPGKREVEDQGY